MLHCKTTEQFPNIANGQSYPYHIQVLSHLIVDRFLYNNAYHKTI
jgi:hypothetical protein